LRFLIVGLISLALAGAASAKPSAPHVWPELGVETSIAFPNHGTIRNFEADGERGIWLEDQQRRWYYARFTGSCYGLNFVQAIGFDTRGSARFDRYAAILVEGDRCPIESLVTAEKPLPHKQREKARQLP
jgi:hypothetical protein